MAAFDTEQPLVRVKNKKLLGIPIPDHELSQGELENLSNDELKGLGVETRFWPWYFQAVWGFARVITILFLLGAAVGFGTTLLSGEYFDYVSLGHKFLRVMLFALVVPTIILIVSYLWRYGSDFVDKTHDP